MNRKQRKAFEASRHEMYMFKAAWLAFLGRELVRIKQANVKDFVEGVDGAIRSAVDAVAAGEVVSIRVEVWKQTDMFEALQRSMEGEDDYEYGMSELSDLVERARIEEELRRQQRDDNPF